MSGIRLDRLAELRKIALVRSDSLTQRGVEQ